MFKTFVTFLRGRQYEAAEAFADQNALTILDQQIRDAAGDLERARRALAITRSQGDAETERIKTLGERAADLEARAVAALQGGREDLAAEAAEAIASLEADLATARATQTGFEREAAKLKALWTNAERRLAELERGRRAARAAEAVRRLRSTGTPGGASALREAEATLKRLHERQLADEAATQAFDDLGATGADQVAEKLQNAGFGETTKPNAKSVLDRLRAKAAA